MTRKSAINRTSVADQVFEKLHGAILSGEIQQGSRIVEVQIAKSLGTSRAPVREAVSRLMAAGLVENRAGHGPSVTQMTLEHVSKVYRIRVAVERAALEEIGRQPSPPSVEALRKLVSRMTELARQPRDKAFLAFVETHMEFHKTLWAMSNNEYIEKVANQIGDLVQLALTVDNARIKDLQRIAADHVPLVDAIAADDMPLAIALMEEHAQLRIRE